MGRRGRLWVGPVIVVVVAGCSAGTGSTSPAPVSPTGVTSSGTAATESATLSSPTSGASTPVDVETAYARVPAAARAHTPQGAQAFAEFYMNQINKAWTTPDPAELQPFGRSSCRSCSNYVTTAKSLKKENHRYESAPAHIKGASYLPGGTANQIEVSVVSDKLAARIVDANGVTVETTGRGVFSFSLTLAWDGGHWSVEEIRLERA
jgi:hypothetical protein